MSVCRTEWPIVPVISAAGNNNGSPWRAIVLDPPLILADEPTAHLDNIQVEEVQLCARKDGRSSASQCDGRFAFIDERPDGAPRPKR